MLEFNESYNQSLPPRKVRIERKKNSKNQLLEKNEQEAQVGNDPMPTRREFAKSRRTHSLILRSYFLAFFVVIGIVVYFMK